MAGTGSVYPLCSEVIDASIPDYLTALQMGRQGKKDVLSYFHESLF